MKKIILLITVVLICVSFVHASNYQLVEIENEILNFTLLSNGTCETTENVFRIERLNYSTGMDTIQVMYMQEVWANNKTIVNKTIIKEINKYTATKTGFLNVSSTENYEIKIQARNKTITWHLQGRCSNQETNVTTLVNLTTNQSNQEEIINISTSTEDNSTIEEEIEQEQACFEFAEIYFNKEIYAEGEQAEIQFYLRPISDSFTITYWIEDLQGHVVKKSYTTNNLNKKTYTFKNIDQPDKAYILKSIISDACSEIEKNKLVVVRKENLATEEELDDTITEKINIKEIEIKKDVALVTLEAQKGATAKSVITCKQVDAAGRRVNEDFKLRLMTQNQKINVEIPFRRTKEDITTLLCEGLGLTVEQEILFPKINNTINSTEQPKITTKNEKEKNKEINQKEEVNVQTILSKTNSANNQTQKESTKKIITSPQITKQNNAQRIILIALALMIIGIVGTYKLSNLRKRREERDQ